MKVEVRLFAVFQHYLPAGARQGAAVLDVPEGSTVEDVTRRLGIPTDVPRMVLVNGRDGAVDRPLAAADVVDVFPPLAGGG